MVPIAASLCISGWALLVFALVVWLVGLDRFLSKPALWGFVGISFLLACLTLCMIHLRQRRCPKVSLALFQHGIRYKRSAVRFDELCTIRCGRESRGIEAVWLAVFRLVGKVCAGYQDSIERIEASNAASLSLVLNDGRVFVMRGIGILCEPEKFEQFMSLLRSRQPHLFRAAGKHV